MKKNHLIKSTVVVLSAMMLLSACGKKPIAIELEPSQLATFDVPAESSSAGNETTPLETTTVETTEEVTEPPTTEKVFADFKTLCNETSLQPKGETVRSFFTGEWKNDSVAYRRPIAVMMNNIEAGLPQRGISKADIIFEGMCEGRITRLMAVFQEYDEIDKLGSIRSCRDYFPFLAAECDAAYFHFGQSDFALEFLSDPELRTFNGMTGKYKYERVTDRVSPHNVFTTPENLIDAMVDAKVTTYLDEGFEAPFKFNESSTPIDCPDGEVCKTLKTGYSYNNAYFVYNEEDGLYYRYQYGQPHIDEMTGEQLAVKNIIIKLVPGRTYWNGSPQYILTGSGLGLYASNGTAQWICWSKQVDGENTNLGFVYEYGYGPTSWKYFSGQDVLLNQGKTWVCIFEQDLHNSIQIIDK